MKETLISLRTEKRYSQNALAKELGISRQAYIKYETGEVEPPVEIIRKLSELFNVSYEILIDNKLNLQTKKKSVTYSRHNRGVLAVASSAPVYGVSSEVQKVHLLQQIQSGLSALTSEQLSSVLTIVNSVIQLNGINQKVAATKKRSPGGLEGKLWMSDDFDEPLDEFKEYM